ncbi:MAG: DUF4340 domain-containing protein [Bacteriovoracaceae bacterium]|nr:DUF4340 domain-containing protein [Bacteriovoracaceae bacterium]
MKRNLTLGGILVFLLTLTWFLTEGEWVNEKTKFEIALTKAMQNPQSIQLPNALLEVVDGVWRTGSGEVARAEVLNELHKSLENIHVTRMIKSPPNRKDFFSTGLKFRLDESHFEFGDLAPSGDSFFLSLAGDPDVYVIDLEDMGSLAVGDNENVLLHAKYSRLRDLLLYPEDSWRETKLLTLMRISAFDQWKKGDLSLDGMQLSQRSWGQSVMQGFLAGLHSLQVKGAILTQVPKHKSKIKSWVFQIKNDQSITWDFYDYPEVNALYVWVPHLGKAYPLDEDSSSLIQSFPERLYDRSTPMTLSKSKTNLSFSLPDGEVINENERTLLVQNFMHETQSFAGLDLLSINECKELTKQSQFVVNDGSVHYFWKRYPAGWSIFDCAIGIRWIWSLPLESKLDFASLVGKD